MEQLNLIPLEGDMTAITRKAEDFREMDEAISRNFSEILVQTMTCLSKVYNTLKESPYGDLGRQAVSMTVENYCIRCTAANWCGFLVENGLGSKEGSGTH